MILVCAATGTEAAACRRGIADAAARGIEVLTTGVGPERAADALTRWLATRAGGATPSHDPRPALVVSSGFAGALSSAVEPLAWITASSVHRLVGGGAAPRAAPRIMPVELPRGLLRVAEGALACHVVSADHVLSMGVSGLPDPAAADMESAALAGVAGAAELPFLVLRLVTDTPTRPLAPVGHSLAAALGAHGIASRAAHGARAALDAARSPPRALAFVREALAWRDQLRAGWRDHASRGVPLV
ncbi:MAG: hypothetical protein A2V77_12835 [Anaeromyxobacter sp. RBG_16_69_14]|nr:MAG: hypothetical protein A2V77_12835 [Anaeromyxobacter sp. RBG_16_69_14]